MNEQVNPEERTEMPVHAETPTDRFGEAVGERMADLRHKAEDLGDTVQGRAREFGDIAGERTREAVGQVRYFSDQARAEAAMRLEGAGHYLNRHVTEAGEYSRQSVRQHPGAAVALAASAGFLLAVFVRRLAASIWRR